MEEKKTHATVSVTPLEADDWIYFFTSLNPTLGGNIRWKHLPAVVCQKISWLALPRRLLTCIFTFVLLLMAIMKHKCHPIVNVLDVRSDCVFYQNNTFRFCYTIQRILVVGTMDELWIIYRPIHVFNITSYFYVMHPLCRVTAYIPLRVNNI